ncbi:MAG: hypothetical protein ACKO6N_25730 [Myxococcota bacterium]
MNLWTSNLAALRAVMAAFPPLESHTPQQALSVDEIYFPSSHAAALDPDRSLVIGNRGMGKSYWASALVDPNARKRIADTLRSSRHDLGDFVVEFGFVDGEGAIGISRDELANLVNRGFSTEHIWRAVVLPHIAQRIERKVPETRQACVEWVQREPEQVRELLRTADAKLHETKGKLIFVFDQLEQLADELTQRAELTRGILRLALAFKSYRALRVKIFMRPDHYADDGLFAFPDASKIKGEKVVLDWRNTDLFGLLYTRLLQAEPEAFNNVLERVHLSASDGNLPRSLMEDEEQQHKVFAVLAGQYLGAMRSGRPYTWLFTHLADARNQVSPRSFLRALKYAAEARPEPVEQAIDKNGIHEGVRHASRNRVEDLQEDYPWVPPALDALRGLLVPCLPGEMLDQWEHADQLMERLRNKTPEAKRPPWLLSSDLRARSAFEALLKFMGDIGVIEIRQTTGKVDVPDIFRLPAGIKRKGGITQQQRSRFG